MADEIRRTPVPRPAGPDPRGVIAPGKLGNRPIAIGSVLLTPHSRAELEKLGWRDGDPIPGDIGKHINAAKRKVLAERAQAETEQEEVARKRPGRVEIVPIEQLPPETQAEFRKYLADYKTKVEAEQAAAKDRAATDAEIDEEIAAGQMSPHVGAAIKAGMALHPAQPRANIIMDEPPPKQAATASPQPAPAAAPAPGPQPQAAEMSTNTGADGKVPVICPRCGHDHNLPLRVTPTPEDWEEYLPTFLGLTVYQKTYKLLGGKMAVTFRGETAEETIALYQQLGFDVRKGAVAGEAEYLAALFSYKLILGTHRILVGGNLVADPPTMATFCEQNRARVNGLDRATQTPLVLMREDFYAKYVTTTSLQRTLAQLHREFNALLENLEARTLDPTFTGGIAPRT